MATITLLVPPKLPPLIVRAFRLVAAAALKFNVPPVKFSDFTSTEDPKFKLPAATVTCPEVAPVTDPAKVALPLPETVRAPPKVVAPDTANEPPETFRELPLLMVNAAMASVPVECTTARLPVLMIAASVDPGKRPLLQLPDVAQSIPPAALVKVTPAP